MTPELPPLPDFAPAFRPRWPGDAGGYTADQLRAYAAEAVRVALEKSDALTFCGCGDQFTTDEPGRCAICVMTKGDA